MVRFTTYALALLIISVSTVDLRADSVDATAPQHIAVVPADVQLEPILSDQFAAPVTPPPPSYLPPPVQPLTSPTQNFTPVAPSYVQPPTPGVYPNMQASWAEYGAAAQPAVPMPCEAAACNNDHAWSHWYFEADLVGFVRGNDARNQRITPSLTVNDLNFDMVAGPYLVLGTFFDPHNQWQLIYFIAPGMSAEEHQPAFGTNVTYDSTFQSVELNYLHSWDHWSFLAGFRYLHLDEQFRLSEVGMFDARFFDMRTTNDLYGGQIGVTYHHEWSWILVEWAAKFGIYGNSAVQHGKVTDNGFTVRGDGYPSSTSGSFENDIFLGHRFSPHWMGRIGLVTLSVSNVALASDMNRTTEADGTFTIVGLTIGALAQW
jgi:hypothetical protein